MADKANTVDKYARDIYLNQFEFLFGHSLQVELRTHIQNGFYSVPQGEHVVFYLLRDVCIDIIGVPHKEMDILSYFTQGR